MAGLGKSLTKSQFLPLARYHFRGFVSGFEMPLKSLTIGPKACSRDGLS